MTDGDLVYVVAMVRVTGKRVTILKVLAVAPTMVRAEKHKKRATKGLPDGAAIRIYETVVV